MTFRVVAAAMLVLLLVAACGKGAGNQPENATSETVVLTAANLGEQSILTNAEYLAAPIYANASRSNGAKHAQLCRVCHSLEKGGPHMIGPNLHGIFGKKSGTKAGFDYSEALLESEFVWTPRALEAWLAEPGRFLPGNRMSFVGVSDADDRADLVAYLLEITAADEQSLQ